MSTTGGFTSSGLLQEELLLTLPALDMADAVEIGEIAKSFGIQRDLPIAVEVRLGDWIIYHASLPGSTAENQWWIDRKARVVMLKHHSTMYERVSAQERGVDWHKENNLLDETHAIHGGGLPLITKDDGLSGVLLISGLPHVQDHLLGVEVLTEFLARKGELL
ncbi:Haem-degrading domain-containing protein [Candidatus Nanopelagicus abundans]|uniref:Haem-degrading domain-containing protein n=1 Tax=Candidatus Nanopelagicus abundans TaxID=1884916 RepID=A0A249L5K6_9ACTN|nr:heme-binding protein [Candidatus Nanopelagicus abundans]ASY24313.1 Haem-degrading domain-containing protein [Candidatus Nanopelagicus abundans]